MLKELTQRQRDCMHLVAQGYQTKEIARHLPISADRINKVVATVRRHLGVSSRREAGRLYVEWESRQAVQAQKTPTHSLASHPIGLPPSSDDMQDASVINGVDAPGLQTAFFAEDQAAYLPSSEMLHLRDLVPLRRSGRLSNDLTTKSTLIAIAGLTVTALITVGSALSLLVSLNALVQR